MTCPYIITPDLREGTSYCRLAQLNGDVHHAAQVAVSQWLQWREDAQGDDSPSVEWIEAMEALQARLREQGEEKP